MTNPIPVDFNRRDSDDNLSASRSRVDRVPIVGDIVDVVDDEENRALARVVRLEPRGVVLEPIWQTFANVSQPRVVPAALTGNFVVSWSSATSMSVEAPRQGRRWDVRTMTGGPILRPTPV